MANGLLLDTCAWLDLFTVPERLTAAVRDLVRKQSVLHLASISLLEVARKEALGQLSLAVPLAEWFNRAAPAGRGQWLELTAPIAIDATRLPGSFHKDPAGRIIVATARHHQLTLVTSDRRLLEYRHVKAVASR